VISLLAKRLENPPFSILTLPLVYDQRSLHAVIKAYYRSMSCFATNSPAKDPARSAKDFPAKGPSCTMWFWQITKYVTKYDTMNDVNPHSTKQETQPISFLISKKVVPYRTHGGTCCHGGGGLLIRFGP
jgi:hypothetical protein